ncbi:MarR family transcriptional regulator [Mucilaginibacter sp. CSA2-8R]|uniref:MarR family winged helix-turn-helix transcriptional regulator n=1 Tax=Mucilaginibacter sp. CSA2-8R TaxID=3141542 RepID=UPI00315D5C2B
MERCSINKDLLLFKIFNIHKIICNKANKLFSKDGVNIQFEQIPVLMVAYYHGPVSQQDIADEIVRDKSSVLRTIASLESSGFLKVKPDVTDKRKKLISITDTGADLAKKIAGEADAIDNQMFTNLSVAEKLILTELLEKCSTHLQAIT